jgi:hypothetical protein
MFFKTFIISGTFVLSVFLILDNINIANGKLQQHPSARRRGVSYVSMTVSLATQVL